MRGRLSAGCAGVLSLLLFVMALPAGSADGPDVQIDTPSAGATVSGAVTVAGSVSGGLEVTHVDVRVDGGAYAPADAFDGAAWSATVDTTFMTNAMHTIEVRARDAGGMSSTASVDVLVDNPVFFDVGVVAFEAEGGAGSPVLSVSAANGGSGAMTGVVAQFAYLYQGHWRDIGTTTFDVGPFGTATFSHTWDDVLLVGAFDVRVTLDADSAFPEQNESNNEATAVAAFYAGAFPGLDPLYPLADDPVPASLKTINIRGTGASAAYVSPVHVVRLGDQAAWFSQEFDNKVLHTATADDGSFDSGPIERGWWSPVFTFTEAGTFPYHCSYHPETMRGVLVVVGNGIPPT